VKGRHTRIYKSWHVILQVALTRFLKKQRKHV